MKVLNCEQTRELEKKAVETGISYLRLMENAGSAAVRFLLKRTALAGKRITVLCGKGNNGGDGFVAARRFSELGAHVSAILVQGKPATHLADEMLQRLRNTTVRVIDYGVESGSAMQALVCADYIIDGVFGIGFHGQIPENLNEIFNTAEASRAEVLALDIPSGVQGDTGAVAGKCIRADYTVTFTTMKPGQVIRPGRDYCGTVFVAPVGIPASLISEQESALNITEEEYLRQLSKPRTSDSNKGTYGTLLSVCGSEGMAGAAYLSAAAALRCGVGLVHVALPESIYPIVSSRLAEPVFTLLRYDRNGLAPQCTEKLKSAAGRATACLIGCGLGQERVTQNLVYSLVESLKCPMVIDADGINALAGNIDRLYGKKAPVILTPHPGEMARLMKTSISEIQAHRVEFAKKLSSQYDVIVVLKGEGTVIASPDGCVFLNPTGNPGMATGGSGDVLAGMIASFLAQGEDPYFSAVAGTYLHGLAGDICSKNLSQRAMLPTDLIERLPELFLRLEGKKTK